MYTKTKNIAMVMVCLGVAACNQMLGTEEGRLRQNDASDDGGSGTGGMGIAGTGGMGGSVPSGSGQTGGNGGGQCEPTAEDLPDDNGEDTNCDGIDGDEVLAVFVAVDGNDNNPGTREAPKATINAALTTAKSQNKTQVLISEGSYAERVILTKGISLYGGYSHTASWARSAAYSATIETGAAPDGNVIGVMGNGIDAPTTIDHLTIHTLDASLPGSSNYGLHCIGCTALTVRMSTIKAGNGAAGKNGLGGASGPAGGNGIVGGNVAACSGSSSTGAPGGAGGASACGANGGSGGRGGNKKTAGLAGAAGACGTPGGGGGGTASKGAPGKPGANGGNGGSGANGTSGNGGGVENNFWLGTAGSNGIAGGHGCGGGGGGGGGGEKCDMNTYPTCVNSAGNGGGGGGAGGCGGAGARVAAPAEGRSAFSY